MLMEMPSHILMIQTHLGLILKIAVNSLALLQTMSCSNSLIPNLKDLSQDGQQMISKSLPTTQDLLHTSKVAKHKKG